MGVAALAWFCWGIATPAPWKDEQFTLDAAALPWPDLWGLLQGQDAVHGVYYALMHAWLWPSDALWWARALSAVAMAAAAAAVFDVGRLARSQAAGVLGAVVFAGLPSVSRYAQDARPGALIVAVSAWCLVAVLAGRWRTYGILLACSGWLSVLALLALPAHALAASDRRRWARSAGWSLVACLPVLVASVAQRQQVAWLPWRPNALHVHNFAVWLFGAPFVWPLIVAAAVAGAFVLRSWWPAALLVPPVATFAVSWTFTPLFAHRYMMFLVPAVCALVGVALSRVRREVAVALAVAVGVALSPGHVFVRGPDGHGAQRPGVAAYPQEERSTGRPSDAR